MMSRMARGAMFVAAVLVLTSCASGELKARFVNGCDVPVMVYASPDVGSPSDPLRGEVFLDDGSAHFVEPGETIDFHGSQNPTGRFMAIVYQGRDYDVYRWDRDSVPSGEFVLEGSNCPSS